MSVKEKILRELDSLTPSELMKIRNLIDEIKSPRIGKKKGGGKAYLRVRQALGKVKDNLAREISTGREERL